MLHFPIKIDFGEILLGKVNRAQPSTRFICSIKNAISISFQHSKDKVTLYYLQKCLKFSFEFEDFCFTFVQLKRISEPIWWYLQEKVAREVRGYCLGPGSHSCWGHKRVG